MNSNRINLIAETAWHHEGDIEFFRNLLNSIINYTSTDYVKLHLTLDYDSYIHSSHPLYNQFQKWLFDKSQWTELINTVLKSGKKVMLLFNDIKSIEFGMQFNPELVEIHSVCLNDFHLLEALKNNINNKTKIVLGAGGSTIYELEKALSYFPDNEKVLMFGFQNYPTKYEDINLLKIKKMMNIFSHCSFGYADHTAWNEKNNLLITALVCAVGMKYVEKHVTIIPGVERTDFQAAISIDQFNELVEIIKILEKINGNGLLELNEAEKKYSKYGIMKKTGVLKHKVSKGDVLKKDSIIFLRHAVNSDLSQIELIEKVGTRFVEDLPEGTVLMKKHFE